MADEAVRRAMSRTLNLIMKASVAASFRKWRASATREGVQKSVMGRMVRVTTRLGKARGFRMWHLKTLKDKLYTKHMSLVRAYWSRCKLGDAWRAWCAWRELALDTTQASQRRHLRTMQRTIARVQRESLGAGFRTWLQVVSPSIRSSVRPSGSPACPSVS